MCVCAHAFVYMPVYTYVYTLYLYRIMDEVMSPIVWIMNVL